MLNKKLLTVAVALTLSAASASSYVFADETKSSFDKSVSYSEFRSSDSAYRLRASDIIGQEVKNNNDEEVGEVDDLVLSQDSSKMLAILSVGGFLGIGDKLVSVPYEELRISSDGDEIYISSTQEALMNQEAFDYNEGEPYGRDVMNERLYSDNDIAENISKEKVSGKKGRVAAWEDVENNWEELKADIKAQWSELTDEDIDQINGDRDMLIDRVSGRYNMKTIDAEKEVDDWHSQTGS